MNPHQYCQDKAAASGSSFYYSFLFLPKPRRQAITALYAFCREVDDIADECSDTNIALTKLTWWRMEIANLITLSESIRLGVDERETRARMMPRTDLEVAHV